MRAVRIRHGDGSPGVALPLRLEFLLTRAELATALAYDVRDKGRDEPLPVLSRAQAVEIVKRSMRYAGEQNLPYWSDYVPDDRADEIQAWADATVERLFGDMFRAAAGVAVGETRPYRCARCGDATRARIYRKPPIGFPYWLHLVGCADLTPYERLVMAVVGVETIPDLFRALRDGGS